MSVETLQDAEQLAEHVIKNKNHSAEISKNPFVQASVLLYNEVRRVRDATQDNISLITKN